MCWFLRVYWTVLHNLLTRFATNFVVSIYNSYLCACLSYSQFTCCFCCDHCSAYKQTQPDDNNQEGSKFTVECGEDGQTMSTSLYQHHDYVIVDEIDANYLEIERRKIETENYYRLVDRDTAEEILNGREDGSCIVRPFKETDISIKYVVTVYAQQHFFHLFIRQINGKDFYGIGQQKPHEKRFSSPSEIIDFYSSNSLQCTNKSISVNLILKPIIT